MWCYTELSLVVTTYYKIVCIYWRQRSVIFLPSDFQRIYDRLGVTIVERGESFYQPIMPEVVQDLDEKGKEVYDFQTHGNTKTHCDKQEDLCMASVCSSYLQFV